MWQWAYSSALVVSLAAAGTSSASKIWQILLAITVTILSTDTAGAGPCDKRKRKIFLANVRKDDVKNVFCRRLSRSFTDQQQQLPEGTLGCSWSTTTIISLFFYKWFFTPHQSPFLILMPRFISSSDSFSFSSFFFWTLFSRPASPTV